MGKVDYKKQMKELYAPSAKAISEVVVPVMNYIMVDGKGDPQTSKEFSDAVQSLYPLAYSIKFLIKKSTGLDFGVMPLEGLWWAEDMADFDPKHGNRNNWLWTLMIMQPEVVTREIYDKAFAEVKAKKYPPMIGEIRFESYDEGRSAQIMHIGPFSEEGPNIIKLHEHIVASGGELSGKHHEIYLSDMRKTAPEKLKTVLRQPFKC